MLQSNRRPILSRSRRVIPLSFLAVLAAALCPAPVHANAGTLIPDAAAVEVLHVWPDGRTLLIRGPAEELALIDSHGNDLPAFIAPSGSPRAWSPWRATARFSSSVAFRSPDPTRSW